MKEYIERDAAIAFLENMAASRYLIQCFESKERFPAVDVAPIRHGEWIWMGTHHVCSVCREKYFDTNDNRRYCSNCGAKNGV
jgi:hypothetical protein